MNGVAAIDQFRHHDRRQSIVKCIPGRSAHSRIEDPDISANVECIRVLWIHEQTIRRNIWQVAADVCPGATGIGRLKYVSGAETRHGNKRSRWISSADGDAGNTAIWKSGGYIVPRNPGICADLHPPLT